MSNWRGERTTGMRRMSMRRMGMRRMMKNSERFEEHNLISWESSWIADDNDFSEVHVLNNLFVQACCCKI